MQRSPARSPWVRPELARGLRVGILAGALLGSLLLIVAEFTTLFEVHVTTSPHPVAAPTAGSLAIGVLGIGALLIALIVDLPDAHAAGLAVAGTNHVVPASASPGIGMYLETLGAAVLVIPCGVGLMAIGPPALRATRSGARPRSTRTSGAASDR